MIYFTFLKNRLTVFGTVCFLAALKTATCFPGNSFSNVFERFSDLECNSRQEVLQKSTIYPKLDRLFSENEQAIVQVEFDGSLESFQRACATVSRELELKVDGSHRLVQDILDTLNDKKFFQDVGGQLVDGILLRRFQRQLVHMKRQVSGVTGDQRIMLIELDEVRFHAAKQFAASKSIALELIMIWIARVAIWIIIGILFLTVLIPYMAWHG